MAEPGAPKNYPRCFDPYLRYAISTEFKNFEENLQEKWDRFDDDKYRLLLLIELKEAGTAADFAKVAGQLEPTQPEFATTKYGIELAPYAADSRYLTMRCRASAVLDSALHESVWGNYVNRVALSLPVKPSSPKSFQKSAPIRHRFKEGKEAPGPLLIGMLDDGCPFSAARFLRTSGPLSTRVRAIWDQNQNKQPVAIGTRKFGMELTDFAYGLEYRRDFAAGIEPQQIGLDDWISLHATATDGVDEDGCYAAAGFTTLARRDSHGGHVMDVLAGPVPISSRIGPSKPGKDRRDPPSWTPGRPSTDPACDADVVFVQFSDECIRDATGVWLKTYVVQGIQYILSFADPVKTRNVIISLSYGPTTGPHDGTAELESALSALVAEYNGKNNKPKLDIVLSAGNAYLSDGHVVFTSDSEQPEHVEWIWRLPPDNTVLVFAEIWVEDDEAQGVTVTLTSPSGKVQLTSGCAVIGTTLPKPGGTTPQLIGPIVWGKDRMWLLEVGPTVVRPEDQASNEHGDWTIKVDGIPENAEMHAYVARTDPNMGARTGAKRSHFVDSNWEQTRSAGASCTRIDGEFDRTGSLLDRFGTLNGIATGKKHRVHVAGGYVVADGRKTPYSSAGRPRGGHRIGPDYVLPCDEDNALTGIRAGGNRSGAVLRLIGTSTAAPQLARQFARLRGGLALPQPTAVPSPNDIAEIAKRGGGDLEPP
ncbi:MULTISPECIES: hypothetical protein [unclassified Bradyrhizobium]|uniref:hypothetical protein n=1 Tax=unclassified Bradyrhizobium TaxID=2631580 RepID=UPI0028E5D873|nr:MULTISPECIES: hypothetical protein [unclassified Bradyrhizobium]